MRQFDRLAKFCRAMASHEPWCVALHPQAGPSVLAARVEARFESLLFSAKLESWRSSTGGRPGFFEARLMAVNHSLGIESKSIHRRMFFAGSERSAAKAEGPQQRMRSIKVMLGKLSRNVTKCNGASS